MRLLKEPYPSVELEDAETLNIFDIEGNMVARVDIGVKSQKHERHIMVYLPDGEAVDTLWLTSGKSIMIVPATRIS